MGYKLHGRWGISYMVAVVFNLGLCPHIQKAIDLLHKLITDHYLQCMTMRIVYDGTHHI